MSRLPSLFAATAAVAAVAALAGVAPAAAQAPSRDSFSLDFGPATYSDICSFPVSVSGHVDLAITDSDQHFLVHATEQNSYTANGHTLNGMRYTYTILANAHGEQADGGVEKVRLPDGSLFVGAGRVDFSLDHGDWVMVPDFGSSPNVGAFCAALAP
jgi:hypothetical protein